VGNAILAAPKALGHIAKNPIDFAQASFFESVAGWASLADLILPGHTIAKWTGDVADESYKELQAGLADPNAQSALRASTFLGSIPLDAVVGIGLAAKGVSAAGKAYRMKLGMSTLQEIAAGAAKQGRLASSIGDSKVLNWMMKNTDNNVDEMTKILELSTKSSQDDVLAMALADLDGIAYAADAEKYVPRFPQVRILTEEIGKMVNVLQDLKPQELARRVADDVYNVPELGWIPAADPKLWNAFMEPKIYGEQGGPLYVRAIEGLRNSLVGRWFLPEGNAAHLAKRLGNPVVKAFMRSGFSRQMEVSNDLAKAIGAEGVMLRNVFMNTVRTASKAGYGTESQIIAKLKKARQGAGMIRSLPQDVVESYIDLRSFTNETVQRATAVDPAFTEKNKVALDDFLFRSGTNGTKPQMELLESTESWKSTHRWIKKNYPEMNAEEIDEIITWAANRNMKLDEMGKQLGVTWHDLLQHTKLGEYGNRVLMSRLPWKSNALFTGGLKRIGSGNFDSMDLLSRAAIGVLEKTNLNEMQRRMIKAMGVGSPEKTPALSYRLKFGDQDVWVPEEIGQMVHASRKPLVDSMVTTFNGMTKLMKTAMSPFSSVRNYMSNFLVAVARGDALRPGFATEFLHSSGLSARKIRGKGVTREDILNDAALIERGIADANPHLQEILMYENQATSRKPGGGAAIRRSARLVRQNETVDRIMNFHKRLFGEGDTAWKRASYRTELRELEAAFGQLTAADRLTMKKLGLSTDAETYILDSMKQTMQSYGRAPRFSKALSRNPLIGAFATFPAESARNLKNIFAETAMEFRLSEELQSPFGRKLFRDRARRKAYGLAIMAEFPALTAAGLEMVTGGDIPERTRQSAQKITEDPWNEGYPKAIISIRNGNITAVDLSHMDYFNSIRQPIYAMLGAIETRGSKGADPSFEALEALVDQFAGVEIPAQMIMEVITNRQLDANILTAVKEGGLQSRFITEPGAPVRERVTDSLYNAWRSVAPGAAVTAENIAWGIYNKLAKEPKYTPLGARRNLWEISPIGRPRTYNIEQRASSSSYRITSRLGSYRRSMSRAARRGEVEAMADYREEWDRFIWPSIKEEIEAYVPFMSEYDLRKNMRGVSKSFIDSVLQGDDVSFQDSVGQSLDGLSIENRLHILR
jgi:hypothetical protein